MDTTQLLRATRKPSVDKEYSILLGESLSKRLFIVFKKLCFETFDSIFHLLRFVRIANERSFDKFLNPLSPPISLDTATNHRHFKK